MLSTILQTGGAGGAESFVMIFILLVALLVPIAVSVYIYRDAKRRGSQHPLAWGIGAFLGGLIVWIIYFVVRGDMGRSGV